MNSREEKVIREYIRESLAHSASPLHEGMIDDAIERAIEIAKKKIEELIDKLKQLRPATDKLMTALSEEGQDSIISAAEVDGDKLVAAMKLAGNNLPKLKEGTRAHTLYREYQDRQLVLESSHRRVNPRSRALNESLLATIFAGTGFILALIGGIPLILKGLAKVMGFLSKFVPTAKRAKEALEHAAEAAHHFEEKVIDVVIPDSASYIAYLKVQEIFDSQNFVDKMSNTKIYEEDPGTKIDLGKRYLTLKEYSKSKERKNYEGGIYAILLLPWIINGLTQLHHALHSVHGAVEAAATAEKALFASKATTEIGKDILQAVTAIEKGAEIIMKTV